MLGKGGWELLNLGNGVSLFDVPCDCVLACWCACAVSVLLSFVVGSLVGASVSRGVDLLTCSPRCPSSPRAVSLCQDGRHAIGTFAKVANSAQFRCSHMPSHSSCQSG